MSSPEQILEPYVQPGSKFDERYWVERTIGAGAYCAVYEAVVDGDGETVALKVIPPTEDGTSETAAGRFERELKVIENLEHAAIVELVDFGTNDDGIRYMVLEYVEGETLEDRLSDGPVPLDEALEITGRVAQGLGAAHEAGVVHRDLKPDNIMLTPGAAGPRPKVLDFGMAKLFARIGDTSVDELTADGMAVGTPRYIAPEQARGSRHMGPWTDVYALGLVLYEMLVGQKAVHHDSIESAVEAHVDPEPLELPGLEDFEEDVQDLVRAMVRKDFRERPDSVRRIIEGIDALTDARLIDLGVDDRDEIVGPPLGGGERSSPDPPPRRAGSSKPPGDAESAAPGVADEDLELDWDRYSEYTHESDERVRNGRGDGVSSRRDESGAGLGYYIQLVLLPIVVVASFIFVSAMVPRWGAVGRVAIGLGPTAAGVGFGALNRLGDRRVGIVSSAFACGVISIIAVHFFGLESLASELWRRPAWFLRAFEHLPVVGECADGIRWAARRYVAFLSDLLGV